MKSKLIISNSILNDNSQKLIQENETLEAANTTLNEKLANITRNLEKLGQFTQKINSKELEKLPASIQNMRKQIFENIKDGALDIFDELKEVDTDDERTKLARKFDNLKSSIESSKTTFRNTGVLIPFEAILKLDLNSDDRDAKISEIRHLLEQVKLADLNSIKDLTPIIFSDRPKSEEGDEMEFKYKFNFVDI